MLQSAFDSELSSLCNGNVKGKHFLLAVSGGIDSMCMASLFLNSTLHPTFSIANVDFSLRGNESILDQKMVIDWASENNIKVHSIVFDTHKYATDHSISTQMAARDLRYEWFYKLLEDNGYDYLSIAHNRDDSVETLFLNLLRGTGIAGLSGIRNVNGKIIRPLLPFSRKRITEYVSQNGVRYRDDATNFESHYSRNRLRNIVFPELREINPSFAETVFRSSSYFSEAASVLDELVKSKEGILYFSAPSDEMKIAIKPLLSEKYPSFFLFHLLERYGFNSSQLSDILASLNISQSGKQFFSDRYQLLIDRDFIKVFPLSSKSDNEVVITCAGNYRFGDYMITISIIENNSSFSPISSDGLLSLDGDKITFPLLCRSWREGDRFRPFGMKRGSKKLSDFYTDLKMDLREKDRQPVILSGEDIVCLPGLRIDDNFKIGTSTKTIIKVTIDK